MKDNVDLLVAFYQARATLEAWRREREVAGVMLERAAATLDEAEFALEAAGVTAPQ